MAGLYPREVVTCHHTQCFWLAELTHMTSAQFIMHQNTWHCATQCEQQVQMFDYYHHRLPRVPARPILRWGRPVSPLQTLGLLHLRSSFASHSLQCKRKIKWPQNPVILVVKGAVRTLRFSKLPRPPLRHFYFNPRSHIKRFRVELEHEQFTNNFISRHNNIMNVINGLMNIIVKGWAGDDRRRGSWSPFFLTGADTASSGSKDQR